LTNYECVWTIDLLEETDRREICFFFIKYESIEQSSCFCCSKENGRDILIGTLLFFLDEMVQFTKCLVVQRLQPRMYESNQKKVIEIGFP
jgi:hypothetical protein